MINLYPFWRRGQTVIILWVLTLLTYVCMVLGTLADIQRIAGEPAFDMRPFGYSYESAGNFLEALGEQGRNIYLMRQIPLDILYPALLALSSAGALLWLSRTFGRTARFYRAAAAVAFVAALADYVENVLIVWMLNAGADLSPSLVSAASMATVAKSTLSTIVFTALLVALVEFTLRAAVAKIHGKKAGVPPKALS